MGPVGLGVGPGNANEDRERTPFVRFLIAYGLTAAALVGFGLLWGERGFEMLVVAMGWPHVLLGLAFYSRKLAPPHSPYRRPFAWLVLLTMVICLAHSLVAMTTLIYLYFVFHAFRDEIFIYRQRITRFASGARVFDASGVAFLAAILVIAASDQLTQLSWRPLDREVTVPIEAIAGQDRIEIDFPPLPDSQSREYYFTLSVPESTAPVALVTYMTRRDADTSGEMLVNERSMNDTLGPGSRHDLYFKARYSGQDADAAFDVDDDVHIATPLSGGHVLGQTFRAAANGLEGIALPIVWTGLPPAGLELRFTLGPAGGIGLPFLEQAGLLVLVLVFGSIAVARSPGAETGLAGERRYFLVVTILFLGAKLALAVGRYYELTAPLFFSFLVVFHYFSWYVFSMEKVAGKTEAARWGPARSWADRMIGAISDRSGFLKAVVALNLASAAGVVLYQQFGAGGVLGYLFDLNYFLYFLVFHVTMSFAPKAPRSLDQAATSAPT